jgi:Cu/Zn superoxide dismutase
MFRAVAVAGALLFVGCKSDSTGGGAGTPALGAGGAALGTGGAPLGTGGVAGGTGGVAAGTGGIGTGGVAAGTGGIGTGGTGTGGMGTGGVGGMATATATIAGFGTGTVTGTAKFTQTGADVTVVVTLANCPDGAHGVHIHQGTSCTDATMQGAHWDMTRGEGIPDVMCTGMTGTSMVTRKADMPALAWTVGGAAATNVIGHAFVVHDTSAMPPPRIGCGLIK